MGREHEVHTALTQPQVLAVTPQMVAMEQSKPVSIEQELGMTT
jgi:hypothetical protein